MYPQAIGFGSGQRLLSGLSRHGDAGAFALGRAMSAQAGLDMDRAQKNQQMATEQMQQESQQRLLANQNQTRQAANMSREWIQKGDIRNRGQVLDTQFAFDSAARQQQRQTQFQQMLLNGIARML